jgi:hopanoid biosynthesis associated protein HpnK
MSRRLIVNADDFGRSDAINRAVLRAHRDGILTTASLMVNEPFCAEAVQMARDNPRLGVGLHLTLLCGRPGLAPARIPDLVTERGRFTDNPAWAGFRYFFQWGAEEQLKAEIYEQLERFQATGLTLDHVNGHLHMHLHPTVFRILMRAQQEFEIRHMRLTFDPFWLNLRLVRGNLLYRASHALIFHSLSAWARSALDRRGIKHTRAVFGLLQNANVDEDYVTRLLPELPAGDSELYSHPSLTDFKNEFDALVSPRARELVRAGNIQLIRYQDL